MTLFLLANEFSKNNGHSSNRFQFLLKNVNLVVKEGILMKYTNGQSNQLKDFWQFLLYWLLPICLAGVTWLLYRYIPFYSLIEEGILGLVGGIYLAVSLGIDFLTLFAGDQAAKQKLQKFLTFSNAIYIIYLGVMTLISWLV